MKKYFQLYGILCVLILAGSLFITNMQKMLPDQEIDYVAVNEIAKQAGLRWQNPERLAQIDFTYRFVIVDKEGLVRYMSDENLPDNLPLAVRKGFVPIDITVGASVMGKALIEASPGDAVKQARTKLTLFGVGAFGLLCVLNSVFLWRLHTVLVKPFNRLEFFAHKITIGRLNEPLPMDKRNIFGLFTQSFDVMRASLAEARQNQLKAERAKKELIASLSHDIKTPVTSIRLITELLLAGSPDPAAEEKLRTIEMKADQIDRLMNDMLHSALEELGELKVNPSSEESGVLRNLFQEADHLSKVHLGAIPDCLVELDVTRMRQVIGNITSNSYKYAGTDIDVEFIVSGDLMRIDVNDYGKGVEPGTLELICTKFYRGENAHALQKEGEGLGLYIAKLLMEKMEGRLEAVNRENGFTIRLWLRLSR